MLRGGNLDYSPSDYDRGSRKITDRDAHKDSLDRDFQSIASKYKGSIRTGEDNWDNQRSPYQQLRGSERAIEGEIDRAYKAQDDRLEREIKNNSNYRQDIQKLRANVEQSNVVAKDYERERIKQRLEERELELSKRLGSPYLNEYEEEVIKRRQHEKELEVTKKLSPRKKEVVESPQRAHIRAAQERREEEILDGYYRKGGKEVGDRLKESVASNKTFELSQSLKSSVNYREKIGGGLRTLEAKIDNMERELDQHLQRNEKAYFTNKELVKATQKRVADEEDEEETPEKKKNQFQEAFARRENKIKEASNYVERSDQKSSRRNYDEEESPQQLTRAYEDELEKLKEQNVRIKQEIHEMKKSAQLDGQYQAAVLMPEHPVKRQSKPQLPKKRERPLLASDAAFNDMARDDDIKKTVEKAKKKIQQKLEKNKKEKSHSKKAVVHYPTTEKYVSLRRDMEKKYTGSATHLTEAAFLLAKGMPTTFCSDTAVEPKVKDPKRQLPRKFEKILSQY